jgi:diguanylate cyclase
MISLSRQLPRPQRVMLYAWSILMVAGLAVFGVHILLGIGVGPRASGVIDGWLFEALVSAAAAGILVRAALVRQDRLAWSLIGAGCLSWAAGDAYSIFAYWGAASAPFPSVADGLYLLFYPLMYAGLVILVRSHLRQFHASQWLDGLAASLMVAAVGADLLIPRIVATTGADVATIATNLAYPLGDLLILSLVVIVAGLLGRGSGRAVLLLAAAALMFAGADTVYLFQAAGNTYAEGGLVDFLWPASLTLILAAAWQPIAPVRLPRLDGWRVLILPGIVAGIALALLVQARYTTAGPLGAWFAAGALTVCLVRAALTFRENFALTLSHQQQATTDALTGLPNRRLFGDLANQAISRARRDGTHVATMIIDLDGFKEVNDTLGHRCGDVLLQEIARNLSGALRDGDTVARLGGDEFAVLLPGIADATAAETVANKLLCAIAHPVNIGELSIAPQASIGIATFPEHGTDIDSLLQHADVAMYTAKTHGLGSTLYVPDQDHHSLDDLTVVGDLRLALDDDELLLHYQPKVALATGTVVGFEALVRWNHPRRGLLMPADFIPPAEHTTLIVPLTLHVIDMALAQCRRWADEGRVLTMSINISPRCLRHPEFATDVSARLCHWQVSPERLELELTESVLIAGTPRELEVLNRLRALGVTLAIDDFGTGYSTLSRLRDLPVDVLKIDRSFIVNMRCNTADAVIVQATIDLARSIGVDVVAEGIEDEATYDVLRAIGCPYGQGYHLGRPMPADQLDEFMHAERLSSTGYVA